MKTKKLDIAYTVMPKTPLSEVDWLREVNAGRSIHNNDSLDKARDMNTQYQINGSLNPKYKKLIDSL